MHAMITIAEFMAVSPLSACALPALLAFLAHCDWIVDGILVGIPSA